MNQKMWIILWGIGVVVWTGWVAGYPNYRKKEARIWGGQFICFWCGAVFFIYQHDEFNPGFYCFDILGTKGLRGDFYELSTDKWWGENGI